MYYWSSTEIGKGQEIPMRDILHVREWEWIEVERKNG